jgi:divalent metal cation (Fe/Co/Zn/Cd) transporter
MKVMQIAGIIVAVILAAYGVLLIGQIWDEWLEWKTFFKITLTAGVLIAVIGIVAIIVKEMLKEKELKKEKYLD